MITIIIFIIISIILALCVNEVIEVGGGELSLLLVVVFIILGIISGSSVELKQVSHSVSCEKVISVAGYYVDDKGNVITENNTRVSLSHESVEYDKNFEDKIWLVIEKNKYEPNSFSIRDDNPPAKYKLFIGDKPDQ